MIYTIKQYFIKRKCRQMNHAKQLKFYKRDDINGITVFVCMNCGDKIYIKG